METIKSLGSAVWGSGFCTFIEGICFSRYSTLPVQNDPLQATAVGLLVVNWPKRQPRQWLSGYRAEASGRCMPAKIADLQETHLNLHDAVFRRLSDREKSHHE